MILEVPLYNRIFHCCKHVFQYLDNIMLKFAVLLLQVGWRASIAVFHKIKRVHYGSLLE